MDVRMFCGYILLSICSLVFTLKYILYSVYSTVYALLDITYQPVELCLVL